MGRKDLFKNILTDNQVQKIPEIWHRTLTIPLNTDKIITLAGVRRSGKTYHLLQLIKQAQNKGIKQEQIFYLNFEDERLELKVEELDEILQSYRELYPDQDLSQCYFFFDEIQEVIGWEKFVARLYNTISRHIFITGSNAALLSKEIATALRGRTITYEVYPLSFHEFLSVRSLHLDPYKSQDNAKIVNLFEQFMQYGGFPELVEKDSELKEKILQEYFNVMVIRDLIERYKVSQGTLLKYFCKRVVSNSGKEWSVNKIYNELKSQGYKMGKDTLYAYQEYVEAIYLNRFISKYTTSLVKTEYSQKKSYCIDTGMGTALDFKLAQDKGRLLESVVALELFKQGETPFYYQNTNECDFIIVEKGQVKTAIQVAYTIADTETKNREIKGLISACKEYGLSKGIILTFNEEQDFIEEDIKIEVISTWKYFL